jgi:hypothetical protein
VVRELKVKLGDKVNIGDLLAILEGHRGCGRTSRGRHSAGAGRCRSGPGSGCTGRAVRCCYARP